MYLEDFSLYYLFLHEGCPWLLFDILFLFDDLGFVGDLVKKYVILVLIKELYIYVSYNYYYYCYYYCYPHLWAWEIYPKREPKQPKGWGWVTNFLLIKQHLDFLCFLSFSFLLKCLGNNTYSIKCVICFLKLTWWFYVVVHEESNFTCLPLWCSYSDNLFSFFSINVLVSY